MPSIYAAAMDTQCQEIFCTGVRTLNPEERESPSTCTLCKKRMCDHCAFGVQIPYDVFGDEPWNWKEHYKHCSDIRSFGAGMCRHDAPTDGQRYDCQVCSDCFNEAWV